MKLRLVCAATDHLNDDSGRYDWTYCAAAELMASIVMTTTCSPSAQSSTRSGRVRLRAVHLVGIAGAGMRGLAELLRDCRVRVTGSDRTIPDELFWKLHSRGIRAVRGHSESHVPQQADVLIYSSAVPADNPERREAAQRGLPQLSLSEAIGRFMAGRLSVSVAGTHGKTTTTALLGHVLDVAGASPSVLVGGELIDRAVSGWAAPGGKGPIVVESCEYRGNFLNLAPKHAIVLNIDSDHFDCFGTLDDAIESFGRFTHKLPADGTLLVNWDRDAAVRVAQNVAASVQTFGSRTGADWWLGKLKPVHRGWSFEVFHRSRLFGVFECRLPGRHQVLNALAVIGMCGILGLEKRRIAEGLRTFAGVKRRFEVLGQWRGVTIVDDYAHHPLAIRATLHTARHLFPNRRIWCAFQPHQLSRTRALLPQFVASLQGVDRVLMCPVYPAREKPSSDQLRLSGAMVDRLQRGGTPAQLLGSLDQITATIETDARSGDVLLILGAGDIDRIGCEFRQRLQQQRAS